MAYLPKAVVMKGIVERKRLGRDGKERTDYEAYFGQDPFTRRTIRISRADKAELENEINEFYARHKIGGDAAVRLDAMQALDAKSAYDALFAAGLNVSLLEVANAYIGGESKALVMSSKKIGEAFDEYIAKKPEGADKQKTLTTTGKYVGKFKEMRIADVTARDISEYLEADYGDMRPKTYNSHLQYIKTFFNWCCKDERGYLVKNPAKSLALKPEPWEEPKYMAPEKVAELFRLLESAKDERPEYLAYSVVSFFCGCRSVEICRMAVDDTAAKISLEDETVRLAKAKGYQQGKKPRAFHIDPTALAWMKSFKFFKGLKRINERTQKEIFMLAERNGIKMFHNCGRHSFITYHVAKYGDPAKTTAMAGTSDKMRADNYCGLASKAEGEKYFAIMPAQRF